MLVRENLSQSRCSTYTISERRLTNVKEDLYGRKALRIRPRDFGRRDLENAHIVFSSASLPLECQIAAARQSKTQARDRPSVNSRM